MPVSSFQIPCEFDSNYAVSIEDDGRVAYAYLLEYGDITGDVWLYNHKEAERQADWNNQPMPWLNPAEYLKKDVTLLPINNENEIRCEWTESPHNGLIEAGIWIRDKFIAQLESGSKPGWSVLVAKDGPLARVY